jgi:hypothetical protein
MVLQILMGFALPVLDSDAQDGAIHITAMDRALQFPIDPWGSVKISGE